MAAKGSKSRRGRGVPPAKPDTEAQPDETGPEEPSSELERQHQSAGGEQRPVEAEPVTEPAAEPLTSPESRWLPEGEGEARSDGTYVEQTPAEDREGETASEPGATEGPPLRRESYRITAGLAAVVVVVGLAGAWFYGTVTEPDQLDQHTQRLGELAGQTEAQASRLAGAEEAIAGLRSEVGQVSTAVSGMEDSLSDLHASTETSRQQLDQMAQSIEALRGAVAVPTDDAVAGEAVVELRASVASLDERVASLEQGDHLTELTGSIARIEEEISDLREQAIARLEEQISDLREQAVGRIEQAQAATALGRTYAALTERLAAGAPFADELEAVAAQLPTAPGLDELRPHAAEGVPTLSDLQSRLDQIAGELPREEPDDAAPEDGVWQTIRERLEGMVTVRTAEEPDWSTALERAEEALQRGNLDGAIAALEGAPDAAPAELDAWLSDARARRDADAALDELSAAVLQQLAGRR